MAARERGCTLDTRWKCGAESHMRNLSVTLAAIAAIWWFTTTPDTVAVTLPDGAFQYPGYEFSAAEEFTLEGRVLSRKDYGSGRESDLSPTDLAMGWGKMADEEVIKAFDISQRLTDDIYGEQHIACRNPAQTLTFTAHDPLFDWQF